MTVKTYYYLRKTIMKEKIFKAKIEDMEFEYTFEYRKVKYIRYQIRNGKVRIIIPKGARVDVQKCISMKKKWLYRNLVNYKRKMEEKERKTRNMSLEYRTLDNLRILVNHYVEKYENQLNVKVNRLQFRDTIHKWGSCSNKKNITLSKNLRFVPEYLVAYIVFHEMTHLIVLDHSDEFYKIIKTEFPNYERCDEKLSQYEYLISQKFTEKQL